MNGKTKMASEVQELGIELQLRTSFDHHGLDVVIPMPMGHASHLSISLDMTLQKKLQALAGIKPHIKVSGVGQNHGKSISHSPGQTLLYPIDLTLLPGEKCQFMVSLPPLLTILLGIETNRAITSLKLVRLQPLVDLRGLQKRVLLIPLIDQSLIGFQDAITQGLGHLLISNHPGDPLFRYTQLFGDLPHAQVFHLIEMPDLTAKDLIHVCPPFLTLVGNLFIEASP
jgi:hypothetical protein